MTKPVVYIVIYSLYHHVYKLSLSIKEGLESKGVDVKLFQVQETLSDEILTKMQAPPKPDLPVITIDKLAEPDGVLFGLPTRFGTMPAQVKALLDSSGALWAKGSLAGKFAGTFFSTASQHGGQETTALTAVTYFSHHGMMYVPFGFANNALFGLHEVVGGSPYGSGTVSDGDGSRQPTETELSIAKNQGANFANVVATFVKGRDLAAGVSATDTTLAAATTTSADSNAAAPTNSTTDNNAATGASTTDTTTTTGDSGSAVPLTSAVAGGAAGAAGGAALATDNSGTAAPATTTTADGTTIGGVTGNTPSEIGTAAGATAAGAAAIGSKGKEASTTIDNAATGTDATTTGDATTADTTTDAAGEPTTATDTGAAAGSTAADNAAASKPNAVKESLVNKSKENKPRKKKWFCCG